MNTTKKRILLLCLTMACLWPLMAQLDLNYQIPPAEIMALVDVKLPPRVRLSSQGDFAVMMYQSQYQSIADLSQSELRLAGLRINPLTQVPSRLRYVTHLGVLQLSSGKERAVAGLPEAAKLAYFIWSPDQSRMAFMHTGPTGAELWVLDIAKAQAKQLSKANLNAALGIPFTWFADGRKLLIKVLPTDRKALIDGNLALPSGPTVSVNDGEKAQNMTFQDLLKNKTDEYNFEQLVRSELQIIDLQGKAMAYKDAAMYSDLEFSPDGRYVLISSIQRPFSYIVTLDRFPSATVIYDQSGKLVKKILDVPLMEVLPKGNMAERTGMRLLSWRADKAATLYWAEVLDRGDPEVSAEFRDELFTLDAPFSGKKQSLLKIRNRFAGITWGTDEVAIVSDYWWNTRNTKTYLVNPSKPSSPLKILFDRNYQDSYGDPGQWLTKPNRYGRDVLEMVGGSAFLLGDGYSDAGVRPFVDRFSLKNSQAKRLWQADGQSTLEEIIDFRDVKKGILLTRIQAKDAYPNFYFRTIGSGQPQALTRFENPFASFSKVKKDIIRYNREDGVELSGTLYLPLGYEAGKKYPMIMWAYPQEFKDKNTAAQITSSAHEFIYPNYGSPLFWLARGYVILDDAAFPIIGEGKEEPNDTFIKQLVANAKAAIDAVEALGYIDRRKVAVGGHSYGAFMTANLLTHSDLFAAGIARSGAYNRTLTPFGFQSEERNYWEAPQVYYQMSPFMHADKMKTPLLLIHGAADNNPGTHTLQSERYFNALKGLGATVRLVLLPKESHGYVARESIFHLLWEQDQWLEKYVKNRDLKK